MTLIKMLAVLAAMLVTAAAPAQGLASASILYWDGTNGTTVSQFPGGYLYVPLQVYNNAYEQVIFGGYTAHAADSYWDYGVRIEVKRWYTKVTNSSDFYTLGFFDEDVYVYTWETVPLACDDDYRLTSIVIHMYQDKQGGGEELVDSQAITVIYY